jgi:ERF superfamily
MSEPKPKPIRQRPPRPEALARPEPNEPSLLDPHVLLKRAIEVGAGIETVERLVALVQEVRAVQAREAWYSAMADFQNACPAIRKTLTARIQTSRSQYSYRYAPLDEILSVVQPVMGPLGLSIAWRSRVEPDRVIVSCRVAHALGHVEDSGEVAMPIVTADPGIGANPPQRVGIALTYARRYSLMAIVGIAPEDDDDGNGGRAVVERPRAEPNAGSTTAPVAEPDPGHEGGPSFAVWGAIQMITQLGGGKFQPDHLRGYFPNCGTKSQLEAFQADQPEAYRAGYLRLRADYQAGKAGPAAAGSGQ